MLIALIAALTTSARAEHGSTLIVTGIYCLDADAAYDCVIITGELCTDGHVLTVTGAGGLFCAGILSINSNIIGQPGGVVLTGGGTHLISGEVRILDAGCFLRIQQRNATMVGVGTIQGYDDDSQVEIASGITLTNELIMFGGMDFAGSGTLRNNGSVRATSDKTIRFGASLKLCDTAGAEWKVDDAEFEFDRAHTGNNALRGDLKLYGGGLLDFDASMTFNNAGTGTATFTWFNGTVSIASDMTFTYEAFSSGGGTCSNPDTSGGVSDPPYEVSGFYLVSCP